MHSLFARMRRFTTEETAQITKQVEKMLRAEVLEACHSPFASGVVLARKKVEDGEDHTRRDNDLLNNPAVPDYYNIIFAPDDRYGFENKADQHWAWLRRCCRQSSRRLRWHGQ
jgi:hypothetical protein